MQVSIESAQGLERRIKVAVPGAKIEQEIQARLKSLAPRAKIAGFRPGKVPMQVVQRHYGGQVRQEVVSDVIVNSFYEAVAQEKLKPASQPFIETQRATVDSGLEYIARFEILPDLTLGSNQAIHIERPSVQISDADVETVIERLRKQRVDWRTVERAAQNDDRVTLDYHGTIDGEEFAGNHAKGVHVVLGTGSMISGFEEGLMGTQAGQHVELNLQFPEDYHHKDVAGKAALFKVDIQMVEAPELPVLDDAFAAQFGVTEGGLARLKADVRKNMQRELDQTVRDKVKQQVMDGLLQVNPIEVPKALIQEESERLAAQMQQRLGAQGTQSLGKLPLNLFEGQAQRRVALGLILSEIVQKNALVADPSKVKEALLRHASTYESPDDVVKWYYGDKQRMAELESLVLEDQVVDWVLEQAQVTDKLATFDEIMSREPGVAA
ncbi:MAG: trigger factor [Gammaproteobacteria bacterium]|nr:trigger factor [Gammaproteobacteria bacterium]